MAGTQYRYGKLACGCIRGLTATEISAGMAGCISNPTLPGARSNSPPERNLQPIIWVALPGSNPHPHRCSSVPAPIQEPEPAPEVQTPSPTTPEPVEAPVVIQNAIFCEPSQGGQITWSL